MVDAKILTIFGVLIVALAIVLLARSGNLSFLGAKFDFSKKRSSTNVEKSKKVEVDQTGDSKARIASSENIKINQKN